MLNLAALKSQATGVTTSNKTFKEVAVLGTFTKGALPSEITALIVNQNTFSDGSSSVSLGLEIEGAEVAWFNIKQLEEKGSLTEAEGVASWRVVTFEATKDDASKNISKGAQFTWAVPA